MFSMNKLLILAAAIAVVWLGFRWWQRQQVARREPPPQARNQRPRAGAVEDMRACRVCGTYIPAGAAPCERADCPQRDA
jgi:uncharacterized iron-regulated membrane protein